MLYGHDPNCQCTVCGWQETGYPSVVMYMAGIPNQTFPGVGKSRPALTEEDMKKIAKVVLTFPDSTSLPKDAADYTEDIEKLVKFIEENFPGAHLENERFLTETIPRIILAMLRLLRKAGIGLETAKVLSQKDT
jgi:hypothetical protein